jgi:hypothetical protein
MAGGFESVEQMKAQLGVEMSDEEARRLFQETETQAVEQKLKELYGNNARIAINGVSDDERRRLQQRAEEERKERERLQNELYNERFAKTKLNVVLPWNMNTDDGLTEYLKKEKLKKDIIDDMNAEKRLRQQMKRALSPRPKAKPKPKKSKSPRKPKVAKKKKTKK